jgi:hypothetical protein
MASRLAIRSAQENLTVFEFKNQLARYAALPY